MGKKLFLGLCIALLSGGLHAMEMGDDDDWENLESLTDSEKKVICGFEDWMDLSDNDGQQSPVYQSKLSVTVPLNTQKTQSQQSSTHTSKDTPEDSQHQPIVNKNNSVKAQMSTDNTPPTMTIPMQRMNDTTNNNNTGGSTVVAVNGNRADDGDTLSDLATLALSALKYICHGCSDRLNERK